MCVCVCVCVYARAHEKENAFIMQCDVSDSINFEEPVRKVRWFLERQWAVNFAQLNISRWCDTAFCRAGFQNYINWSSYSSFSTKYCGNNGDFNITYYQINSFHLVINTISWMSILYYPSAIHTYFSCSVSSHNTQWNIFLSHKPTLINLHSELMWINSNFLPNTPEVEFSALTF